MNLLENYIEEIHSEKPYTADWTKVIKDKKFVEVDITTNCYGTKTRDIHIFSVQQWELIKENGYYMG